MIRLATRVSIAGGRESVVRLLLTALGLALGVTLLLFAAVAWPALHAHDVRAAWTTTSARNVEPAQDETRTDPLLWRVLDDRFDGRAIVRVDVAALGPDAPVPPGLARLPRAGEIAASPAMARLLRDTEPALLGDRYTGRITATVGRDALESPDQLVVVVGHAPAELRGRPDVVTVRSIEARPVTHGFTQFLRIALVVGGLGLLVPILVFVSTATRLATARREQRLAAMRLAGATPRQAGTFAGVEAVLSAAAGTALGFVLFLALRPYAARLALDGSSFYESDLRLAFGWGALIAIGVPSIAVLAALASLRRVAITPLGVSRHVRRARPSARRLLLLTGAFGLFAASLSVHASGRTYRGSNTVVAVGIAFALIVVGIVVAGPWLTTVVARCMQRAGRGAPSLLAARRLEDDPAAGFRAISGLILAVFVASIISALAATFTAGRGIEQSVIPPAAVGMVLPRPARHEVPVGALDVHRAHGVIEQLSDTPGVQNVVAIRALPDGVGVARSAGPRLQFPYAGAVTCRGAQLLDVAGCPGTVGLDLAIGMQQRHISIVPLSANVSAGALARQPVIGLAVFTNGSSTVIERVRTQLDVAMPSAAALSGADLVAEGNREVHDIERLSNTALVVTLLIAGCSLSVAVAGGLVERKRPFALLRLAGMPLRDLHRVVFAEAAAPLLGVAATSVLLGFAVDALMLSLLGSDQTFRFPTLGYWCALAAGLACALAIVAATLPLLDRLTSLETARFE